LRLPFSAAITFKKSKKIPLPLFSVSFILISFCKLAPNGANYYFILLINCKKIIPLNSFFQHSF